MELLLRRALPRSVRRMISLLSLALVLLPVTSGGGAERKAFLDEVRSLATDGVPIDRVWISYDFFARKFFARYPQLRAPAEMAGVPLELGSREEFGCAALQWFEAFDGAVLGITQEEKERFARRFATWLALGRIDPEEVVGLWLQSDASWRRLPELPSVDLEALRARCVVAARKRRGSGSATRPIPAVEKTPEAQISTVVPRVAVVLFEDFLAHYGDEEPMPLDPLGFLGLFARAAIPPSNDCYGDVAVDPHVRRGLALFFRDLGRELLGIDVGEVEQLLAELPEDAANVIALGGYLGPAELAGVPFHPIATAYAQLAARARQRVVWLGGRRDLEALLEDPSVHRLRIAGHGSMESFQYYGFVGAPEETIPRALTWMRLTGAQPFHRPWRRRFEDAFAGGAVAGEEIGLVAERFDAEDALAIARRPGFRRKERIVLYACSVNEVFVRSDRSGFRERFMQALKAAPEAGSWLDLDRAGPGFLLGPLTPSADHRFRAELPALLASIDRRPGETIRVDAMPNVLAALAVKWGRFAGTSWAHDFIRDPEGTRWDTGALVEATRATIEAKRGAK